MEKSKLKGEEYLVVSQTHHCRNCRNKAVLKIVKFKNNGGTRPEDRTYLLCKECIKKIQDGELNVTDITTYGWSIEDILKRSRKFDAR